MRPLDLIGQRFGKLLVISRNGSRHGKSVWRCLCDCGNYTDVTSSDLTRKNTTSCKCFRRIFIRGNQLPEGESGFNGLYGSYRRRARKNAIEFQLSKKFFSTVTKEKCFYCGKEPSQASSVRDKRNSQYIYNGIDRTDSLKGYVEKNCVPCCSTCNYMKRDMSYRRIFCCV